MSAEDYAHACQLSKSDKSCFLVELTYQVLWATSLLTHLAIDHEELLLLDTYFQGVGDSKAQYTLTKANVASFERDCYGCAVV